VLITRGNYQAVRKPPSRRPRVFAEEAAGLSTVCFPFEQVPDAIEPVGSNRAMGKVVVRGTL
jgi:hypothetical protein